MKLKDGLLNNQHSIQYEEQDGRFNDWPNQDLNVNPLNYYLGALLAELSGPGYQNMAHNGTAWPE